MYKVVEKNKWNMVSHSMDKMGINKEIWNFYTKAEEEDDKCVVAHETASSWGIWHEKQGIGVREGAWGCLWPRIGLYLSYLLY